ncbi:hypothetical protein MRX96_004057 [Rhipicephalus microplus]
MFLLVWSSVRMSSLFPHHVANGRREERIYILAISDCSSTSVALAAQSSANFVRQAQFRNRDCAVLRDNENLTALTLGRSVYVRPSMSQKMWSLAFRQSSSRSVCVVESRVDVR